MLSDSEKRREAGRLRAELERLVRRLAVVEPDDVCTVPLALDTALARLMIERARLWDVPLASLYHSAIVHGLYHAALEDGDRQAATETARLIKQLCPPAVWQRFLLQHPQEPVR